MRIKQDELYKALKYNVWYIQNKPSVIDFLLIKTQNNSEGHNFHEIRNTLKIHYILSKWRINHLQIQKRTDLKSE